MSARATLLFCFTLAACGQSSGQRLNLDFTSVSAAAILAPGDTLTVRARAAGFDESVVVSLDTPTFSLEVPSGTVLIEAEADRPIAGKATPYYFGDTRVMVLADSTTDVVVPLFPAGGLEITVKFASGFTLPGRAVLEMTPAVIKPDESSAFDAELVDGHLYRPLPAGDYSYKALISTDAGKTWKSFYSPAAVLTIVQSQVLSISLDLTSIKL